MTSINLSPKSAHADTLETTNEPTLIQSTLIPMDTSSGIPQYVALAPESGGTYFYTYYTQDEYIPAATSNATLKTQNFKSIMPKNFREF